MIFKKASEVDIAKTDNLACSTTIRLEGKLNQWADEAA